MRRRREADREEEPERMKGDSTEGDFIDRGGRDT
jgi:hypothetical protein